MHKRIFTISLLLLFTNIGYTQSEKITIKSDNLKESNYLKMQYSFRCVQSSYFTYEFGCHATRSDGIRQPPFASAALMRWRISRESLVVFAKPHSCRKTLQKKRKHPQRQNRSPRRLVCKPPKKVPTNTKAMLYTEKVPTWFFVISHVFI